jgi:tungstate transport system substrate-binding protein
VTRSGTRTRSQVTGTLAWLALALSSALAPAGQVAAEERFVTLASTTSTDNSGLYDWILPRFTQRTGIEVRVIAVGTGQALRIGRNGDADVLLVHDRESEERFVAEGAGVERVDVMYNDFVVVGPSLDPAGIRGDSDVAHAMTLIAGKRTLFVSRGDDSGTHKAEMRLWRSAGLDPTPHSGTWYREAGAGMGATLNTASAMEAYTLSDRGTWMSFGNRGSLEVLVEGQPPLFNPYGAVLVNPERHAHVKAADGQRLIDWLISSEGQRAIASFELGGAPLFHPNARPTADASSASDARVEGASQAP